MVKLKNIYRFKEELNIRSHQGGDFITYNTCITIKESGKTPVVIDLEFTPPYPEFGDIPKEKHQIRAASILQLYAKLNRWVSKYGYEII